MLYSLNTMCNNYCLEYTHDFKRHISSHCDCVRVDGLVLGSWKVFYLQRLLPFESIFSAPADSNLDGG